MTSPIPRRALAGLAAAGLVAACATFQPGGSGPTTSTRPMRRGAALSAIRAWEDERWDGNGQLEALARHKEVKVREQAVTALGRLPVAAYGTPVTSALVGALNDPMSSVRRRAAFALGMRADPGAAPALRAALTEVHAETRAAVVEAASKLDSSDLREGVLSSLEDPSVLVRMEAAVGPHRWPGEDAADTGQAPAGAIGTAEIDTALVHVAGKQPRPPRPGAADDESEDARVVWRALFTLQRRRSTAARQVFLQQSRAESYDLVRLFAVKGLAALEPDSAIRAALEHALRDPDWRVVVEALRGLAHAAGPRSVDAIERTLGHASAHVRAAAFDALGYQRASARISGLLERARVDRSPTVRASAFEAEARVSGAAIGPDLELKMTSRDSLMRAACARAAALLPSELAVPYLVELSKDRNLSVAGAAILALGMHPTPTARERLLDLLQGRDNGLRLAAVLALRETGDPGDIDALRRAFERSSGDIGAEVRFNCLRYAGEIGGEEALTFVEGALNDPHPYVRQVAFEILEQADRTPSEPLTLRWPRADVPRVGTELGKENPTVQISTNRGLMTFELFVHEAPVHVYNFLELAQADHYDGLNFHRVVADFVIQGGCYRGDGNGASPWRGDALRQEIGPRKYVRGSLGMPRNEDMESGGSQFFVTHCPTPHLDGRYTIFGELRSGSLVLDAIEVGDVILDVRLVD